MVRVLGWARSGLGRRATLGTVEPCSVARSNGAVLAAGGGV